MDRKLRIGLMLDSYELPQWEYILVERIINSSYASIVVAVLNENKISKGNFLDKVKEKRKRFLFDIYTMLDQKLFDVRPNALERRDATSLLNTISRIDAKPIRIETSDSIDEEEISAVRNFDLDILINLGCRIPGRDILTSATYGVWSYRYGDYDDNRSGPPGFRDVMENRDVTESTLEMVADQSSMRQILCRSFSQSDKRSVHRNMNKVYWKSLSFIPRKLEELFRIGPVEFFKKANEQDLRTIDCVSAQTTLAVPSNWSTIRLVAALALRFIRDKLNALFFFEQWIVLFGIDNGLTTSFREFKRIVPPKDKAIADPFVIRKDRDYYIFVEEISRKTNKGRICVIRMDDQGKFGSPTTIIDRPYHLSYPFVFEHDGHHYLVPESSANHTIQLYRCVDFPYRWEFQMNLMENIRAVDTTLLYFGNRWWLFSNIVENPGASSYDELFLFYADSLFTTAWTPHPRNPIVTDVRRARPAGRIFSRDDRLCRPSQNNAKRYGYSFQINEIETISEYDYEEVKRESFEPGWDARIMATHTFNSAGNLTVIDGVLRRRLIL